MGAGRGGVGAAGRIHFEGMVLRSDIAARGLERWEDREQTAQREPNDIAVWGLAR